MRQPREPNPGFRRDLQPRPLAAMPDHGGIIARLDLGDRAEQTSSDTGAPVKGLFRRG